MAEECSATSSSNWWTDAHASAWSTTTTTTSLNHNHNHNNNSWTLPNPNMNSSNSTCEEPDDVSILSDNSFTNNAASNHSGLSINSSSRRFVDNNTKLIGETPSDHHLWNQVLLNVGSDGVVQNGQNVGDNQLLNSFSAKNLASGLMFDPACDYLKKMDSGWDFSNPPPFNSFDKNFSGNYKEALYENERLSKLSNMVSNWSIAPPQPEIPCQQFGQQSSNLDHHSDQYQQQTTINESRMSGLQSCNYGHALDERTLADQPLLGRPVMDGANGYQMGNTHNIPMNEVGDNSKYFYGLNPDLGFDSSLCKPIMDRSATKTINIKNNFYSQHSGKQSTPVAYPKFQTFSAPSSTRSLRKEHLSAGEGKKKRSDNYEDNFDTNSKKPKHDNTYSGIIPAAFRPHAPKAKFADKITGLQQIVSPFGKSDTASVLWEAIGYIKCLQDQIEQLFNTSYPKNNSLKEIWRGCDHMKGNGDLKSRGLCLMPTESTPSVYRDNSGPDFWAPSYRGFLYR